MWTFSYLTQERWLAGTSLLQWVRGHRVRWTPGTLGPPERLPPFYGNHNWRQYKTHILHKYIPRHVFSASGLTFFLTHRSLLKAVLMLNCSFSHITQRMCIVSYYLSALNVTDRWVLHFLQVKTMTTSHFYSFSHHPIRYRFMLVSLVFLVSTSSQWSALDQREEAKATSDIPAEGFYAREDLLCWRWHRDDVRTIDGLVSCPQD